MTWIWHGKYGAKPDLKKCRASVKEAAFINHQCTKKATVWRPNEDGETYGYCRQHDPVLVKQRRDARSAKWDAKWQQEMDAHQKAEEERRALLACKEAIQQIAGGHNDARGLAVETLKKFPNA